MKTGTYILAIIWGTLMIQPLFANFDSKVIVSSCAKNKPVKPSCSKTKCNKPKPEEKKKDCERKDCNPLLSCPTGNFYIHINSSISINALIIPKQKNSLVNDNRILKQLTECWHPPEII